MKSYTNSNMSSNMKSPCEIYYKVEYHIECDYDAKAYTKKESCMNVDMIFYV